MGKIIHLGVLVNSTSSWFTKWRPCVPRELQAGVTKAAPNEAFERHRMSNIEEVTANQPTAKKKVFGSGAREMHDADIAQICAKGFSAEAAANALRNNSYNVTAALQVGWC